MNKHSESGFTLIEVLIALSILAIALTALLKATAETVVGTQRIKEKTLSHTVAMQAIASIQLGLTPIHTDQETTQSIQILNQTWYWKAQISETAFESMQKITITTSLNKEGPFHDPLIGFKVVP